MNKKITIDESELDKFYQQIVAKHKKYLKKHGVKLPKLKNNKGEFTKNAIVLCLLAKYKGKAITKEQITENVRKWYSSQNDMQQARHLSAQSGWYICSGMRGDTEVKLKASEYQLYSLVKPYPSFLSTGRQARGGKDFGELKTKYDYRCATCGSKEGEASFINKSITTKLQQGHMDPNKALTMDNMIPQCDTCNRAYKDWFLFDGKGRVKDINIKSSRWQKKYKLHDN